MIENTKPLISDKLYNVLNNFVKIVLPAIGALYFGLSQIWGLPYGEEVVGSIALITVFLAAILLWLKNQYENSDAKYDGEVGDDGMVYLNNDALAKDAVVLKTPPTAAA